MPTAMPSLSQDRSRRFAGGILWLLIAGVATAVFFRQGLMALGTAWQLPEYSHGPLIPVISAFLFARQFGELDPASRAQPVGPLWPGVALVIFALLAGLVGTVSRIDDLVAYAMLIWIGGMVLLALGWRLGRQFWAPVLHLVFMLPLPGLLHYAVSTSLQMTSSQIGVGIVQVLGVPVVLSGNIIDLGSYKLHVAEACSGLRYLFPILSFSYVFAVLYQGPMWHRVTLLLAAVPIAVAMNALRIAIVAFAVDRFGQEAAMGVSHLLEGWVIFLACLVLLVGLAAFLVQLRDRNARLSDALDLDFQALKPAALSLSRATTPAIFMGATLLTLVAGAVTAVSIDREPAPLFREPLSQFPATLGDWQLEEWMRLAPEEMAALGADDYLAANYTDGMHQVELFIAYYEDQSQGGVHSPQICLPGGGWEIASIDVVQVTHGGETFPVTRAVIQRGTTRQLVHYWFEQHGRRTAIDWKAKLILVWDSFLYGRSDGALVRLVTPMPDLDEVAAEIRLDAVTAALLPDLSRFVPTVEFD
jgi:exosortase D (VPLPA-CTERM-specific)